MNMHVQPALAGTTPLCLVAEPLDMARAKNKYRVGEIVKLHGGSLGVVLPSGAKRGKDFFRFMYSEEIEGEYHSRISMSLKSDNYLFEQMGAVTPTLELEESGCHLHALLTTNQGGAGEIVRDFVDLPAFEATLTRWFETLRSIPAGSLDVLRNVLDGSAASDRLLNVYEKAA
jgi:hypothetical protein